LIEDGPAQTQRGPVLRLGELSHKRERNGS
jgi:hypothetical protein